MARTNRIRIPTRTALAMIGGYTRTRLADQLKSVSFIIVYLAVFQIAVLRTPPVDAAASAAGIAMVVVGLALFLEGLVIGLMPLGERIGIRLPERGGLFFTAVFGFLLGTGATLAEPAVAILRNAGSGVTPWEAPLLFALLNRHPEALVLAIALSVGLAVVIGMFRFYFSLPIKPFIFAIVPIPLVLSAVIQLIPGMHAAQILGLAWDTGAVTTGVVTVPLVLALGIGVSRSRSAGSAEHSGSGFGVVMLASALPALGVIVLGLIVAPGMPDSSDAHSFFSAEHRTAALELFENEEAFFRFAAEAGIVPEPETSPADHTPPSSPPAAPITPSVDRSGSAASSEPETAPAGTAAPPISARLPREDTARVDLGYEALLALRAVGPLSFLLAFVLTAFLKDRPRYPDETALGIVFAFAGMIFLSAGIGAGLVPFGDEVGRGLPAFLSSRSEGAIVRIDDFDRGDIVEVPASSGERLPYLFLDRGRGPELVPFDPQSWDPASGVYTHTVPRAGIPGLDLSVLAAAVILVFAFGLGYGSTLAEPALQALGKTVETLTIGTVKRRGLVSAVSVGVGIGIAAGTAGLLAGIPAVYILVPGYVVLLAFTAFSDDEFCAIAWDCGGVTTGPVTVPLVIALGLGMGRELGIADAFGVLASASMFPILTVLVFGLAAKSRQRTIIRETEREVRSD